jgi:excisionase family DNA binding protein
MRVHAGQLSLLATDESLCIETTAARTPAARQKATRHDKPAKRVAPSNPRDRHADGGSAGLLTTDEAATLLRVHPRTVQRLVERGELCAVHLGSAVRFELQDVDELVARLKHRRRTSAPPAPTASVRARPGAAVSFADKLRSRSHEHRAAPS